MLGIKSEHKPVSGESAKIIRKYIQAVEHYKNNTATEDDLKCIEEIKKRDLDLRNKIKEYGYVIMKA